MHKVQAKFFARTARDLGDTYGMQDIELSPFQRTSRSVASLRSPGLDALDVADMLDVVDGTVAAVAGEGGREGGSQAARDVEDLHLEEPRLSFGTGRAHRVTHLGLEGGEWERLEGKPRFVMLEGAALAL